MNKRDLKKLSKFQLIKMLLKQEKKKPKVVIVDDTKPTRPNRPPPPIPEGVKPFRPKQTVKLRRKQKVVDDRPGWLRNPKTNRWIKIDGPTYRKLYPMQHVLNKINKMPQEINETSKSIDDKCKSILSSLDDVKPSPKPSERQIPKPWTYKPLARRLPKPSREPPLPPTPKHEFNFDDDIFQTENQSLEKFKIISVQSRQNKKFKSYTNEFKVKILKKLDDVKEVYYIFKELVKTVKKRRKLSNNDMIRVVIQNEELPNAISTKFNKVESFKLGDLENIINIMEYRGIPLETSKIIVQSIKIPTGKGRLYLTKDTISRKGCIITVKNDDTTCLARSIVTAIANLHPENGLKLNSMMDLTNLENFRRNKQ